MQLSGMIGRQLPFFSVIVPFWLIWAFVGWRGMMRGLAGDPGRRRLLCPSAVSGIELPWTLAGRRRCRHRFDGCAGLFLRVWKPRELWLSTTRDNSISRCRGGLARAGRRMTANTTPGLPSIPRGQVMKAWMPWIILSVFVFMWGMPQVKAPGRHLDPQDPGRRAAQPRPEGAAGRGRAPGRGRRSTASTCCPPPAPASCWRPSSAASCWAIRRRLDRGVLARPSGWFATR